jgi:hypothetical protein
VKIRRWRVLIGEIVVMRTTSYTDCVIWIRRYARGQGCYIEHWDTLAGEWLPVPVRVT